MDDDEIYQTWREFDQMIALQIQDEYIRNLIINDDEEVNHTISGYDARTFPRDRELVWVDNNRYKYIRQGRSVFDFKGKYGIEPKGIVTLQQSHQNLHITIHVEIVRPTINSRPNIEEGTGLVTPERHYSKVCGRALVKYHEHSVDHYRKTPAKNAQEEAKNLQIRRRIADSLRRDGLDGYVFEGDALFTSSDTAI